VMLVFSVSHSSALWMKLTMAAKERDTRSQFESWEERHWGQVRWGSPKDVSLPSFPTIPADTILFRTLNGKGDAPEDRPLLLHVVESHL
jgi:hypothetical protein